MMMKLYLALQLFVRYRLYNDGAYGTGCTTRVRMLQTVCTIVRTLQTVRQGRGEEERSESGRIFR